MSELSEDKQKELAEKFRDAIISAYPTEDALEPIVFDVSKQFLGTIAHGNGLSNKVFYLVTTWAIPKGKFHTLLEAAYKNNPGNPKLKQFYEEVKQLQNSSHTGTENPPNPDDGKHQPPSWLKTISNAKSKIIASGAFLLFGLAIFVVHTNRKEHSVDPKYTNLVKFLKAAQWEDADIETSKITRTLLESNKKEALYIRDFSNFPCTDLLTIEEQWLNYSDKRFGFSKQQQIWDNLLSMETKQQEPKGYAWPEFLNQVGWTKEYTPARNFPDGHFPAIGTWWDSYQPGWMEKLFSRLEYCKSIPTKQ